MTVLAIGTMTGKPVQPHHGQAEQEWVATTGRPSGLVGDIYIKHAPGGPVLVLHGVTAAEAPAALAELPFLAEGLTTFEYFDVTHLPAN